jgi:uncharacterized cupin superfamily protein
LISSKNGEIFSKSAVLTKLFSFKKLFVHHEILAPGTRASSPHCHTDREEMIFVLEGVVTAHQGDEEVQLRPGDFIGFQTGSKKLHFVENTSEQEARLLVICSNDEDDQVLFHE